MQTKTVRKSMLESKSSIILQEYAKASGGTYVPSSFKGWKYTSHHVKVELAHGLGGVIIATLSDSSSSSNSIPTIELTYKYRPRRKLECYLCSIKRPIFLPFQSHLRPASMPNSAVGKLFHAKSSHPSVLRSVLKHDGLDQELLKTPKATFRISLKGQAATLNYIESCKKPDVETLNSSVRLMKLFIRSLQEQGIIYESAS
ncbi:hypothetical protein SAMN04488542_1656 [Fontibacillus panacisegetis]|uniref:Uncharacterized protein n=1 Tax=Fontibacillus panacisegetis TaxID=670482 RepID=A0A1G7VE75_9BACL|nr:hypothetical protein [Fontibacillus panacisegetis]SDG57851.1 hypothetical protein SAMN04488542_1656 [Fontibacillus panacisegetis]